MPRKTPAILAVVLMSGFVVFGLGSARALAQEGGPRHGPRDTGGPSPEAAGGAPRAGKPKLTKMQKIFRTYDKDGNGKVSGAEWLKMFHGLEDKARLERVKGWGRKADRNKNGSITFDEFKWYQEVGKRQPEGRPSAEANSPARRPAEK